MRISKVMFRVMVAALVLGISYGLATTIELATRDKSSVETLSNPNDGATRESLSGQFPLVRLPSSYSTETFSAVEFEVPDGMFLVLVLDPDSEYPVLPVGGTWVNAVILDPSKDQLILSRSSTVSVFSSEDWASIVQ